MLVNTVLDSRHIQKEAEANHSISMDEISEFYKEHNLSPHSTFPNRITPSAFEDTPLYFTNSTTPYNN